MTVNVNINNHENHNQQHKIISSLQFQLHSIYFNVDSANTDYLMESKKVYFYWLISDFFQKGNLRNCTSVAAKPYPMPKLLWHLICQSQSIPNVHLVWCMTLSNVHTWQSQKLSHAKIPIICPFFNLSKPKQINKGHSFEDQMCL